MTAPTTNSTPQPRLLHSLNLDRQMATLRFSPCGRFVAGGGYDATVRLWRIGDNGQLESRSTLSGHHGWVEAVAFFPDRRRLVSVDSWGEARIWSYDPLRNQPVQRFTAHDGWIHDVAVSSDGRMIATCGRDGLVRVWSDAGRKLREFDHEEEVLRVAFHPRQPALVSGDLKGNVYHWNLQTGRRERRFDCSELYLLSRLQDVGGIRRLAFDAQGGRLACAGTKPRVGANVQGVPTIRIFDWTSGRLEQTIRVGSNGDGFVYDLAFHPRGYLVAVTSGNPGTGKFVCQRLGEPQPFFTHTRMPNCHALALHPTGSLAVVAATNSGSNGNGRQLRNGEYPGNYSPLHVWQLESASG